MNETENSCAGVVLPNALANAFTTATLIEHQINAQHKFNLSETMTASETMTNTTTTTTTTSSYESTIMENTRNCDTNAVSEKCLTANDDVMQSTSAPTITPNERICLIGAAADDCATRIAAESFGVPIEVSSNGMEFIGDTTWTTYFVMDEFNGAAFDAIRRSKHRIYGPPALQQVANSRNGLTYFNRPIYNFAMKDVITCFTGIRKKDELTRLVNLIHSMGGSIRKDLNSKVTHLICNSSSGNKYQYAMTFRLAVIRPCWVHDAWEHRNDPTFSATDKSFLDARRLKAFEGQRICFFGFPPDEHQHMIEILKSNGGIPTDLEDPDCSHVIISNNADQLPESLGLPATSPQMVRIPANTLTTSSATSTTSAKTPMAMAGADKFLPPDGLEKMSLNETSNGIGNAKGVIHTPKKPRKFNDGNCDGVVLPSAKHFNEFLEPANISPILHNIEEEEESEANYNDEMIKRKRDSFDNISIISTDSLAPVFNSAKKPKLIRSGSITRSLRRSMSFVGLKNNPISNMIRTRRNSIDPNASINSITSMESTFSESIKRPVKEKLQNFKDRFMKTGNRSKREFCLTPKSVRAFRPTDESMFVDDNDKFIAPDEINAISCKKLSNSTMIEAPNDVNQLTMVEQLPPMIVVKEPEVASRDQSDHAETTTATTSSVTSKPSINSTLVGDDKQELKNGKAHIVKSEWFWYTIQNGFANETDYLFGDYLESIAQTPGADRRDSLPMSLTRRKRKRFSIRNAADSFLGGSGKRRSSLSDAGLSVSGSFLDYTASPSGKHDTKGKAHRIPLLNRIIQYDFFVSPCRSGDVEASAEHTPKNKSMRYNHFMDLFGTESNYVGILHTIVSLFQKPLEEMADTDDQLLNKSELRAIFNNFSPIHEVHLQMLNHFREMQSNWSEHCLIGKIIIDHREALIKAYPPYVNFFEQMKEALHQCDAQNPRFHAFLKINQAKPECGRQTLQDLMIRPVQRLPSMSLLINDILKHTAKSNPDYKELEKALKAIKEVMTYINEDKRKTEGRLALFDIFNDIDNCPADLVSSHRSFISKCEVTELSNCLSGHGDPLMIFLFTDYIEICKVRKRGFNNIKSPTGTLNSLNTTARAHTHHKAYKHIRLIPLSAIPCVYDISDSPRAFAITNKDKLYCFNIFDDIEKIIYLKLFCKQLAENACRADAEQFLRSYESHELGIDISDINFGTLKKVYNYARTRLKVSRAFSFKSTPLKLKRAVSTTSPLYGSTNSLTPSAQMAKMKLASCTNIHEVGEEMEENDDDDDDDDDEDSDGDRRHNSENNNKNQNILKAPLSVQPTRKAKSSTLSIAALRRI